MAEIAMIWTYAIGMVASFVAVGGEKKNAPAAAIIAAFWPVALPIAIIVGMFFLERKGK